MFNLANPRYFEILEMIIVCPESLVGEGEFGQVSSHSFVDRADLRAVSAY
jgi:hypothetical protein